MTAAAVPVASKELAESTVKPVPATSPVLPFTVRDAPPVTEPV